MNTYRGNLLTKIFDCYNKFPIYDVLLTLGPLGQVVDVPKSITHVVGGFVRIALVQLSDIHIADAKNEVLGRASHIRAAVRSCVEFPEVVTLLYTGDIAFSGKTKQYDLANEFCSQLKSFFDRDDIAVSEIFIPGNHDVDFGTSQDELRDIANTRVKEDVGSIEISGTLAKRLLVQQDAFYSFVAQRTEVTLDGKERLFHQERVNHGQFSIDFNMFNTAFTSTLSEHPGTLVFPDQAIPADVSTNADLVISVLHHPLHWLEPGNAQKLRKFVESGCDLIFTGHDHLPDSFLKLRTKEQQSCYIEGSSLHDPPARSAFNVVEIDLESKYFVVHTCVWNGEIYSPGSEREFPLVRNIRSSGSKFRNTVEFGKWLDDPGTPYTHNRKRDLHLSDFFVYPTMRKDDASSGDPAFVDSDDCLKYLQDSTRVVILGEEGSGKTALGKSLYRQVLEDTTFVPLFLSGEHFNSVSEKETRALIRKSFDTQYGSTKLEQYVQLDPAGKVLILDDWHKVRFNPRGQARILEHLKRTFGRIIAFSSDLLAVEQVTLPEESEQLFGGFHQLSLSEFGVRLRGKLIEKWLSIGHEFTVTDSRLAFLIKQSENRINSILEKNFLPCFPFVVLTLLQADDAQTGNANLGSYGHLYELLITRRLGETSDKLTDLGTKYTYISRLAYHIFLTNQQKFSAAELQRVHDSYCAEYGQIVDLSKMLRELEKAQILSRDLDSLRFKYKACYCYFVAKYFQENLALDSQNLQAKLIEIADRVYFEDYSNIIIFFIFLTKDPVIIKRIVDNADLIYSELTPCNFTSDVAFINSLLKETSKILIESSDPQHNREEYRRQQDDDRDESVDLTQNCGDKIEYDSALSDLAKISIAFRNLRILGHVLRNFTGVLRKEPKKELAKASYGLALRILKRVLVLIADNKELFRAQLADVIRQRRAAEGEDKYNLVTEDSLKRDADEALIRLTRGAGFGLIKRLSQNLGSEDLALTYFGIRNESGEEDAAVRLIDLAIRLDHFGEAPKQDIEELAKMFRRNSYSFTLLQDLVAEYLYLNVSDQRELQKIGSLVDINVTGKPSFLLNKKKALQSNNNN